MSDEAQAARDGPWRRSGHHYGLVLLLILVSLIFQLAAPDEDWARVVAIALQGADAVGGAQGLPRR